MNFAIVTPVVTKTAPIKTPIILDCISAFSPALPIIKLNPITAIEITPTKIPITCNHPRIVPNISFAFVD